MREKLAEDDSSVHVAVAADGEVVGMALVEPCRDDDGLGAVLNELLHISMCFVKPEAQRLGVGRALLRHIFDTARATGIIGVSLWTSEGNVGAIRLYESSGMSPTRTREVPKTERWVRYEVKF